MSEIGVRVDHPGWDAALADPIAFARDIAAAALAAEKIEDGVEILLSGDDEVQGLNAAWRKKDAPTNVLSFPASKEAGYCGDVVLAFETVHVEAQNQKKSFAAHAAHLITHGVLHLIGYDHEEDGEAEEMEARERAILAGLGYEDPYAMDV